MVKEKQVNDTPALAVKALRDLVEDLEMRAKNGVVDCSHGVYCAAKDALSAQAQDIEATPTLVQLRSIIDKAEFWKGVTDADDYKVAADHIATEIVDLLACAAAPAKQEETDAY